MIVTLGVGWDGGRHVAWERQPELLWRLPAPNATGKQPEQRLELLRNVLEPMLQREIEHRGMGKANRGFEAKLISWIEAVN